MCKWEAQQDLDTQILSVILFFLLQLLVEWDFH